MQPLAANANEPVIHHPRDRTWLFAAATALWLLFVYNLSALPLTDPDEGRYAVISREMLQTGDWLLPRLFGLPYLEKPPLLYWLTAASFEMFGTNEFAARLAPSIAAAIGVIAAGLFGSKYFGSRAGLLACLVLGTSGLYVVLARTLLTDMLFATGISVALLAFHWARERGEGSGFAVAWLGLALAVLSKGPAAVVLAALVVGIDSIADRSFSWVRRPGLWLTLPIFLVVALPWFVVVQHRYPEFFSFYLWKEHLNRAAGSEHSRPFYWYVPILLGGFLPWTPLAIGAVPDWLRTARMPSPDGTVVRFLLVWAAVVFVVFSLAVGKLSTYILPMFTPLALLVAYTLNSPVDRGWLRGRRPFALSAAMVLLYAATTYVLPRIADEFTAHPQIVLLAERIRPEDEVAMFGGYFPSLAFYLQRTPLLVGVRQELRFGRSLENSDALVPDLERLRSVDRERRLYCLTDNRAKRADELAHGVGPMNLLSRNRVAALWVRADGSSPMPGDASGPIAPRPD